MLNKWLGGLWDRMWQWIEARETRIAEEEYMYRHWDNGE